MTRKLPEDVRRQQILDAALRAFAADGYGRVTMTRIAREAGLTKGGVYFHFASKEEVFSSMVDAELERRWAEARALAEQVGQLPPADALREALGWWFAAEQRASILTPAILAACIEMDRPREAFQAQVARVTALLADALATPLEALGVDIDPHELAELLMVFRVGAIWKLATADDAEQARFQGSVLGLVGRLAAAVGAAEAAR